MTVNKSESVIRELLDLAGIQVHGPNAWDIQIHDQRFYHRVLSQGSMGLGESYMDGWWDCEAIDEFFDHVLRARLNEKVKGNFRIKLLALRSFLLNLQSRSRAFEVGERHYDIGNELFESMLDKRLTYSCGYWKNAQTLDEAQEGKLDLICKKIGLIPGIRILEIGCGWGSFAQFAAERYSAVVTGITISKEQYTLAQERCKGLPVEIRIQDYRDVQGSFDAVVSIGMFEHVGPKNYRMYMETADRCLNENGIVFLHTIGSNVSNSSGDPWSDKYIFPNGILPSIAQISGAMENLFVMEDWHNFGPDYDKTLMAWHTNFEKAWPQLKQLYDDRFYRMWHYYLLSNAGSFRSRNQQLWQIVMTRPGTPQSESRF